MSFVTRNLKQDVTYWTRGAKDDYGNPSWSAATTIKGRWEDRQEKVTAFNGDEIITRSIVYVGVDFDPGTYLYLGTSTASSPPSTASEIRGFSKIPSVKATQFERKAYI